MSRTPCNLAGDGTPEVMSGSLMQGPDTVRSGDAVGIVISDHESIRRAADQPATGLMSTQPSPHVKSPEGEGLQASPYAPLPDTSLGRVGKSRYIYEY